MEPYVTHELLGVTRGDDFSCPTMENMIQTMMMVNMSIDGNSEAHLNHLYNYKSTKGHHIQATYIMGDGKPLPPCGMLVRISLKLSFLISQECG